MSQISVSPPKNSAVAYLLWFFLGGFGIHRFYLGQTKTAIIMLVLTVLGYLTLVFIIGVILLAAVGVWWIVDAFLIPGLIRQANAGGFQMSGASAAGGPVVTSVPTATVSPTIPTPSEESDS
jgi:TM2 domain-containing membrane protein YozV